MMMSEQNSWALIRLNSSVMLYYEGMLNDARDKEEELSIQLQERKQEKKAMKKERKEYANELSRAEAAVEVLKKDWLNALISQAGAGAEISQAVAETSQAVAETLQPKEWDKLAVYEKCTAGVDKYKLKHFECIEAISGKKLKISENKRNLKVQKAEVKRLKLKRDSSKDKLKNQLKSFNPTGWVKMMEISDLTALRVIKDIDPPKTIKFTLGSSIKGNIGLAINDIAKELRMPTLRCNTLYEWDGVFRAVGPTPGQ